MVFKILSHPNRSIIAHMVRKLSKDKLGRPLVGIKKTYAQVGNQCQMFSWGCAGCWGDVQKERRFGEGWDAGMLDTAQERWVSITWDRLVREGATSSSI